MCLTTVSHLALWAWRDGVVTPTQNHRESARVMSASGSVVSIDTVKRQCVEMSAKSTKKEMTISGEVSARWRRAKDACSGKYNEYEEGVEAVEIIIVWTSKNTTSSPVFLRNIQEVVFLCKKHIFMC